ncbi:hypothetical protein [Halomonas sp. MCCC 1A11062]|uniref:hypothetical protein n=1 Tax=Halomonas sp. MCCC 1A11062 TaxID=2733485 RepID=UPI001F23DFFF|nr:hypothetical protein [Halomonas sp. MCCC 1A11062]MCE8037027.1 hypothetical protein [Halomonas sp. MCCC 1A11062]
MKTWMRALLFISAFSPALITMAYVRYDVNGLGSDVIQLLIVGLIGSMLPFLILILIRQQGEIFNLKITKIESNDFMHFAFFVSYFVPLIMNAAEVSVTAIFFVVLTAFLLLWLSSSLPAHPLLRIMRFRFYKVESSAGVGYILISKRNIRDPHTAGPFQMISDAMLMETKRD